MDDPKILIAAISTSGHREGGMERHLDLLVDLLRPLAEVHVLTTAFPPGRNWDGCAVHAVDSPPAFHGRAWWRRSREAFLSLREKPPFRAVISEGYAGAPLAALPGFPPAAVFLHGFGPEHLVNRWREVRGLKDFARYGLVQVPENLLFSFIEARFCRSARWVWAVGERIQRIVRCYGVHPGRIHHFPNWLDDGFRPSPGDRERHRAAWGASGGAVFLFNSVLSRQKGAAEALSGFALHARRRAGTKLVVVGEGEEAGALRRETARLGLEDRVLFLGHRPHAEIAGLLSAADVFLMPTLRIEGLPYSTIEAACLGLPVIASPRGGVTEVLGDQALYAPPGNARRLSEAMDRLSEAPGLRGRIGAALRERALPRFQAGPARRKLAQWVGEINS